jgi:hypothetical protein
MKCEHGVIKNANTGVPTYNEATRSRNTPFSEISMFTRLCSSLWIYRLERRRYSVLWIHNKQVTYVIVITAAGRRDEPVVSPRS